MNAITTDTRFKNIESLINKYPIEDIDTSKIKKIKEAYQEYTPKYSIINKTLKITDSQFYGKLIANEIKTFKHYIFINEPLIDIKISFKNKPSDKLINKIYSIVRLFQKLYENKKVVVTIALSSLKRMITSLIIDAPDVNGGQTDLNQIEVFREEEVLKVLMHELCHYFKLDCGDINKKQEPLMNKFNIKTPTYLSVQEAFTEYLAMLHHIAIISYYTNIAIKLIYHYEKMWSLYQVCKILNHYKMEKFEDLKNKKMIQGTNVFCYYIIKFFILYTMDNKCSVSNLSNILDNKRIINMIDDNMNMKFDKCMRMTLFDLLV
jgi:hypothetical protein